MVKSSYSPAVGRFLISEPFMGDPNFKRTVVLLVEHGIEGTIGFILNRNLKLSITELVEDLPDFRAPVFIGGPVEQNTLHYVHRMGHLIEGSRHIAEDIYWGGNFEQVKEMIRKKELETTDILFFIGYSGWNHGQLQGEMDEKAWIVAPEDSDFVFQKSYNHLWKQVLSSLGTRYRILSNYPVDPQLN